MPLLFAPGFNVQAACHDGLATQRTDHVTTPLLQPLGDTTPESQSTLAARVMLLDDDPIVIDVLKVYLEDAGYTDIIATTDASRAVDLLRAASPDLLITDLMMPEVDGFEILRQLRADIHLSHTPVIVLTSSTESNDKLRALELGATDFLAKPVDPSELVLRLHNNLTVKAYQDQIQKAHQESDRLLLSILPASIAERLKRGETDVTDYFEEATVLFADLVNFTSFASKTNAATAVQLLNQVFNAFDQVVDEKGLEKIKTIGDSYMLAGGLPMRRADHASAVVDAGLAMLSFVERLATEDGPASNFLLRIGAHTGPVAAGVIGTKKFYYDLWGDTVNVASRMESTGIDGRFQISEATRQAVGDEFQLEARGAIEVKGKGEMETFFVLGRRP
jgi:class 3 adenylate cyclase